MPVIPSPYAIYQHVTSGGNLIKRAMRMLNLLMAGENPSASETADGLEALNSMIDSWNTESMVIPSLFRTEFVLTSGVQVYTIGPGANIDLSPPVRFGQQTLFIKDGTVEVPLVPYNQQEWALIPLKDTQSRPLYYYYEKVQPNAKLNFWPVPDQAWPLILYTETQLAQIVSAQTSFSLPPSYAKALAFNLAVDLAPEYARSIPPEIAEGATTAKANLKRANQSTPLLSCDVPGASGPVDISALFGIPSIY